MKGLLTAWQGLEVLRETVSGSAEWLLREHEQMHQPGKMLFALGIIESKTGLLVLDPSKSWWSQNHLMERVSKELGRHVLAMVDEQFNAFGVRWFEQGRNTRVVLRVGPQLELQGPTMIEEVGFDMSQLNGDAVRSLIGVPSAFNEEPMRVLTLRDHVAEELLR